MTYAHSRQPKEIGQSTSSAAVSPAKTSASQAKASGSPVQGPVFGTRCTGSLAKYDRDSSLWRTSQRCLDGGWQPYSATFPRSGTTLNGTLYLLQPLVRRTGGKGFGLWPTPDASMGTGGRVSKSFPTGKRPSGTKQSITLNDAVKWWPTPTTRDASNNGGPSQHRRNTPPLNAVAGGALNPTWVEWLMGFPLGWTDCEDSATQSSPKSSS